MAKHFKMPVKDKDVKASINGFLRGILEKGLVHAILVPQEVPSGDNVVQTLVRDPEALKRANPLSPVMGVHSSRIISKMTKREPNTKKVAVVLKPCEWRALVALVKLKQASLENMVIIGMDCPGTFPITHYKKMMEEGASPSQGPSCCPLGGDAAGRSTGCNASRAYFARPPMRSCVRSTPGAPPPVPRRGGFEGVRDTPGRRANRGRSCATPDRGAADRS